MRRVDEVVKKEMEAVEVEGKMEVEGVWPLRCITGYVQWIQRHDPL